MPTVYSQIPLSWTAQEGFISLNISCERLAVTRHEINPSFPEKQPRSDGELDERLTAQVVSVLYCEGNYLFLGPTIFDRFF